MLKRLFISVLLLCALATDLRAESAVWSVQPKYDLLTSFSSILYKAKQGGRVGIIDRNGMEVVPMTADSITDLRDGFALVLNREDGKFRLAAIVSTYGAVNKVSGRMYVDDFAFFSEDMLPVMNEKGKYGFVDTSGVLKIEYQYGAAHPFCEGLAAVSKAKKGSTNLFGAKKKGKFFYIDKGGNPVSLQDEIGDVYLASSFKNGEAWVINTKEKCFVIKKDGSVKRFVNNKTELSFDDKYAVVEGGGKAEEQGKPAMAASGIVPYMEKGFYGYKSGRRMVLPAQFVSAEPFVDGYAIVQAPIGYGALRLINGEVKCKKEKSESLGDTSEVTFAVDLPDGMKEGTLSMRCKSPNGVVSTAEGNGSGSSWDFTFEVPKGKNSFTLIFSCDKGDLEVWNSSDTNAAKPSKQENQPSAKPSKGGRGNGSSKPAKKKKKTGKFA